MLVNFFMNAQIAIRFLNPKKVTVVFIAPMVLLNVRLSKQVAIVIVKISFLILVILVMFNKSVWK
jgi:hypothetical protein